MYDYLVVGAGLSGATFAWEMADAGKKVLVIDRRMHLAGNIYDENCDGINVHRYGPHILHTDDWSVIRFLERFTQLQPYHHKVRATCGGKIYSFPINLETFGQLFGITTPKAAREYVEHHRANIFEPSNFADDLLARIGPVLYRTFYEGYTRKHWGVDPKTLPADYAKRIPIRFTFNDAYYNDRYEKMIPSHSAMVARMLDGIDTELGMTFQALDNWRRLAKHCFYTGRLDELFGADEGELEYVPVEFQEKTLADCPDYQGVAVMNHPDAEIPYTRVTEHKHLVPREHGTPHTVLTFEYPGETGEPCYPVGTAKNVKLYEKYRDRLPKDMTPGGRLGLHRYLDMDDAVLTARNAAKQKLLETVREKFKQR